MVVFTPTGPGTAHQIINTSDAPLTYLALSTKRSPDACYYPDSDKWLLRDLKLHGRVAKTDYWDGEQSPPKIKG